MHDYGVGGRGWIALTVEPAVHWPRLNYCLQLNCQPGNGINIVQGMQHSTQTQRNTQGAALSKAHLIHVCPLEHALHRPKDLLLGDSGLVVVHLKNGGLKVEALVAHTVSTAQQLARVRLLALRGQHQSSTVYTI